jgi:hypothetical protein
MLGCAKNRYDFNQLLWTIVSPRWHLADAASDRTAYRWRLGLAKGDPKYDNLENRLFAGPAISVAMIAIASD